MRGSLKDAYKTLSDYDRHYSSVRSALATFLFSLSYGSMAVLFKDVPKAAGKDTLLAFAMLLPFIFLLAAFLLSCYFQRLTYACRIYMEGIEKLPDLPVPLPTPPEAGLPITDDDLQQVRRNLDLLIKPQQGLKEPQRRKKTALLRLLAEHDTPAPRFFGWDAPNIMLAFAFIPLLLGCLAFFFWP